MFQQPGLLYLLPLAALPIIIHLLNRLRYKTVPWAAMMYLLAATRTSTRRARLRQFLIMMFRILVLLFFIFALARPLAGGWLGWSFSGVPDTIVILLDRSASMEEQDPGSQISKRRRALDLLARAADTFDGTSRIVLIDSAQRSPQTLPNAEALPDLPAAGPTDTAANLTAMLGAAADYMQANRTGRTELWIASDLQQSNWGPNDAGWERLRARLNAMPQDVRIRLLAMTGKSRGNRALAITDIQTRNREGNPSVDLNINISRSTPDEEALPVSFVLNGVRSQLDLLVEGQDFSVRHETATEDADADGWGALHLPADYARRDNSGFFVYSRAIHSRSAVVSRDDGIAAVLQLASAPAPELLNQSATRVSHASVGALPWSDLALLVWQGPLPQGPDAELIQSFLQDGGQLVCFPSGIPSDLPFLGARWGDVDKAPAGKPHRVASWIDNDGPLANAYDGTALPLADLQVRQRQAILLEDNEDMPSFTLASYPDGRPAITRLTVGDGQAYFVNSLPSREWSDLSDGVVLVPVLQRILADGTGRLSKARQEIAGIWQPDSSDQPWLPVDGQEFRDPRWHAGVYRSGDRLVALNAPLSEQDDVLLPEKEVRRLFGSLDVTTLNDESRSREDLQSEIWRLLVYFAMISLVVEGALLGPARTGKKEAPDAR